MSLTLRAQQDFAPASLLRSGNGGSSIEHRIVEDNDSNALNGYITENYRLFLAFTRTRCRDFELTADIVQESISKIYRDWDKKLRGEKNAFCREPKHFRSWIYEILKNTAERLSKLEERARRASSYSTTEDGMDTPGQNFVPDINTPYFTLPRGAMDPAIGYETINFLAYIMKQAESDPAIYAAVIAGGKKSGEDLGIPDDPGLNSITFRTRVFRGKGKITKLLFDIK